ncbi:MAG: sugar phosphate isomerase/epimerase family protein [Planctomycetota bacterium]
MVPKIAINSGAYVAGPFAKNPLALDDLAKQAGECGYQGIEIAPHPAHGHPDSYPTKRSRAALVKRMADCGLEICGYGADMSARPPAVSEVGDYLKEFKKYLAVCEALGAKTLRVDTALPPPLPPGVGYDEAWHRVVAAWRGAAKAAQPGGVTIVWEFEPGFMFNKPSEAVKMVEDVGQPNSKVMFDTCHAQMCAVQGARQAEPIETLKGGVVELAHMLKGRIGRVHLIDSDNTLHDNETSTHAPFGTGVLDFDEIVPAILDAEYNPEWWCVDLCFSPEALTLLKASRDFVADLLARHITA